MVLVRTPVMMMAGEERTSRWEVRMETARFAVLGVVNGSRALVSEPRARTRSTDGLRE